MSSCAVEVVCGFRTIIGSGGSSGIWKMHRKYVSWHNTLRSEPLFPAPLYFQSKEVTSVHAPHPWDARETQPVGVAPHRKGPVSQLCPEARSLGNRRTITSLLPCKTAPRPAARRNRNGKAAGAAHNPHQRSKISASLALRKWAPEVSGLRDIPLNPRRSFHHHSWNSHVTKE